MSRYGAALRQAIEDRGISPSELAATLGVTRQAVHQWLDGTARPRTDRLVQLQREYGVPPLLALEDRLSAHEQREPAA
jgi:transcriptional regulator with XRE-family HTH domain